MRWDDLFGDLEAQAATLEQAERAAEIEERTRAEVGAVPMLDRLRAAVGESVRLHCAAGFVVSGTLARVSPEWLLIEESAQPPAADAEVGTGTGTRIGTEALVATAAVLTVRGAGRRAEGGGGVVASRLGLRQALRGIARDRSGVRLCLRDGSTLAATIDRVGQDYVEVALHPAGEARRASAVRDVALVAFSALVAVRRGR